MMELKEKKNQNVIEYREIPTNINLLRIGNQAQPLQEVVKNKMTLQNKIQNQTKRTLQSKTKLKTSDLKDLK